MDNRFKTIPAKSITDNTFSLIDDDWMLITAGTPTEFNTMTASWGGLGILWNKEVCFCFVRPQRHTYSFIEKGNIFTLSFFNEKYRPALQLCGSKSGRDIDKVSEAGLTPYYLTDGGISFSEARLIIKCKKIYSQDLEAQNFLVPDIDEHYLAKDYHRLYIGEIIECLTKDE